MNKPLRLFLIAILHLALLWGWIALLDGKRGPLPPVGRFLSPFEGFWRNGEDIGADQGRGEEVTLEGLTGTVVAEFDHRGVPHLFAPDLHALFFAQGYVTARDRLWQMDIQSRAGLGRLAEVFGPGLVRFDQERRRMGMPASAVASLEIMRRDSLSRIALEAYSAGVNSYITSLKKAGYPLEFKLLDYEPTPWTPLRSVALIKNMQWTLSRGRNDAHYSRLLDSLGNGFLSRYYPLRHPGAEPVFPYDVLTRPDSGQHSPTLEGIKVSGVARETQGVRAQVFKNSRQNHNDNHNHNARAKDHRGLLGAGPVQPESRLNEPGIPDLPGPLASRSDPASGSNNFVIASARTRARAPILANDPHLDLTLPSLWYEIQLKSGEVNAYGVSIPGLPGIVAGFTTTTSWGFTNGMNDVFDWLELKFQNDSLNHYVWRGRWRATRRVEDTILVRGQDPVIDTQLWTHVGPVPDQSAPYGLDIKAPYGAVHGAPQGKVSFGDDVPPRHALQWTATHPSNELGAFLKLLTAQNVPAFRRAMRGLETPAQNAVFATRHDIALGHFGRMPVKRLGQGRMLARGTVSPTEWRAYLPVNELPFAANPARGWLASANQELTGANDPRYFGSEFYAPERSQRLHRLLFNEQEATVSSAWDVLRDDYSRLAAKALPLLLRHVPQAQTDWHADSSLERAADASQDSARAEDTALARLKLDPKTADSLARVRRHDDEIRRASDLLRAWDFRYTASSVAPVLFDLWWRDFYQRVWVDDLRGDTTRYLHPSRAVTLALLASDSSAAAFDDARTPAHESAGELARASFDHALAEMHRLGADARGSLRQGRLTWGRYRPVTIPHLLRLGPLGVTGLEVNGCGECVNAQKTSHGPSWRMVVQTGKRPEAWGIYPGGQSGNPGSARYDAFVKDWAEGRAYRLLFLKWPLEVPDSTGYILALKAKR